MSKNASYHEIKICAYKMSEEEDFFVIWLGESFLAWVNKKKTGKLNFTEIKSDFRQKKKMKRYNWK